MSQDQPFEIPQELRQLAEENVERARQLYLQFMDGVGRAMATWSAASSDVITPGFHEVQERAVNSRMRTLMPPSLWQRRWPRPRTYRNCLASRPDTCNLK